MRTWLCLMIYSSFLLGISFGAEPLQSIKEVRALTLEQAKKKVPVRFEAQVLKIGTSKLGLFMHDGENGIYLALSAAQTRRLIYKQGDVIVAEGVTHPGNFLPHIEAKTVKIIGHRPLSQPLKLSRDNLYDVELDCAWVEAEGIIVGTVTTNLVQSLRLKAFGETISVVLPYSEETAEWAKKHINSSVTVRGALGTKSNKNRQMTGRQIQSQSLKNIKLAPLSAEGLIVSPINELMSYGRGGLEGAKVQGVITHETDTEIYIQSGDSSLLIRINALGDFEVGQRIEAVGKVTIEPFSPALYAQEITVLDDFVDLVMTPIVPSEEILPVAWNHSLVELEATLIEKKIIEDGVILNCSSKGRLFEARLNDEESLSLELNSVLKLRGICELSASRWESHAFEADGFSLILRSPADIEVLSSPVYSWWTLERVLMGLGIGLAVLMFAVFWVWLLKKKVREQATVIGAQVEREAVMNERQRLARELHDSFEQNMSGLALQLNTAEHKLKKGAEVFSSIGLAKRILEHCIQESRESIYDLRRSNENSLSSSWHDDLLLSEANSLGAEVNVSCEGDEVPLDHTTRRHVSKIVRESAFNALRHGKAKVVDISYRYNDKEMLVEVRDNGDGFDPDLPPPQGHFGILGMRERAKRIHAAILIVSEIGKGATISLKIPTQS